MNLTEDQIQRAEHYLSNKLPKEEIGAFETELQQNQDLRTYVEVSKQMSSSYDDSSWWLAKNTDSKDIQEIEDFINSEEGQRAKAFLQKMSKADTPVKRLNNRFKYIVIAASLLVLLSIPFLFPSNTNKDLYTKYSDYSNLPSFVSRNNDTENKLSEAENLFKKKQYRDALELFQNTIETSKNKSTVLIYKGLSQIELKQYDQAEETFNTLIDSDFLDAEKGYWYKALLYLRNDKIDNAVTILDEIVKNSFYNAEMAKDLLIDIKE